MNAVARGKQATKLPRIIVRRARNYILNRAFRAIFLILIRVLQYNKHIMIVFKSYIVRSKLERAILVRV